MKTTAFWILASIFGSLAVLLTQTNHLALSNCFGAISVVLLVVSLFTHRVESKNQINPKTSYEQTKYPLRELHIVDFAGVKGEVIVNFGALTLLYGTSKLNQYVVELLRIFSDREKFEQTRQLPGGVKTGKLQLVMSDGKEVVMQATTEEVAMFIGNAPLPVFSSVFNGVRIGKNFELTVFSSRSEEESDEIEGLSTFFGVSAKEVRDCIQGVATDRSLFNYNYKLENGSKLLIKVGHNSEFSPIRVLSSGELKRFMLDMAIRIATYSAKVSPTVMTVNQSHISSLDAMGWANFLEWVEKSRPSFQVVVDCCRRPSEGELSQALCYDAVGTDMAVTSFVQRTWPEFQKTDG